MPDSPDNERIDESPLARWFRTGTEIYGVPVSPTLRSGRSQTPLSVWGAMRESGRHSWPEVRRRWAALVEETEYISHEEFRELAGERDIQWHPSMTRQQTLAQVIDHDRAQIMSQFESRPFAEFLGALPVWTIDPVSVATLPIGGAQFRAAMQADNLLAAMAPALRGGTQVGAASVPLEVGVQLSTYGEIRPGEVALAAAGPVAFSPLLVGLGRAVRSWGGSADVARRVAENHNAVTRDPGPAIQPLADNGFRQAPFAQTMDVARRAGPDRVPTRRLSDVFDGYDGGRDGWVRDFSAFVRRPTSPQGARAAQWLRDAGYDPDAPALRTFFDDQIERTARTGVLDPRERVREVQDLTDVARGRASEEQVARLEAAGIITAASEVPPRPPNRADAALQELGDWWWGEPMRLRPEFSDVVEALAVPARDRTDAQRALVEAFETNGAAGIEGLRLADVERRFDEVAARMDAIDARLRGRTPSQAQTQELGALGAQLRALDDEATAIKAALRHTEMVDERDLMAALDVARLESPLAEPRLTGADVPSARVATMIDEEFDQMVEFAAQAGIDVAQARRLGDTVVSTIMGCPRG